MKNTILIPLLLLFIYPVYSQITITGTVKDRKDTPIEFANVVLLDNQEVTITGVITNNNGTFSLTIPASKQSIGILTVSFMGYQDWRETVDLTKDVDLKITLFDDENSLGEVKIVSKKKLISRKSDRLVFNVENSKVITGSNGLDVLKVTPRIKVNNDKIAMIGKGRVMVMVNSRMVRISGQDLINYLKSINSDDIKSVEVIPNPPAKYSAEGNSGLVNINLRKSKHNAWNLSLRSTYKQAAYTMGSFGAALSVQKSRIQFSTSVNYTNGSSSPQESNKIFYKNFTWDEVNNLRGFTDVFSTRFGVEYRLNNKISTGVNFKIVRSKPLLKEVDKTKLLNIADNSLDSIIKTLSRGEYHKKTNSLNYYLVYKVDTTGKKLSFDFDYFDFKDQTNRVSYTQLFFPNAQPIPNSLEKVRNFGDRGIKNYSFNLDMEHPIKGLELNYGGRISFTKTDNLFDYYDIINNQEILNANFSNQFNYQENTQSFYFSVKKSFLKKWEAQIGLRSEITQTKGISETLNQANANDYSKLFPTTYITYNPDELHSFSLNYGRRIDRPHFGYLNPFRFVYNAYAHSEGNPFLKPAFIDNLELGYAYKNNFITNVYYSYTDDEFEQITIIDTDKNTQKIVPLNFIVNKKLGLTQTFIFKPVKWLGVNTSADLYYSDTNSKISHTLQSLQYLRGWTGEFRVSNNIVLNQSKTIFFNTSFWVLTKGVNNLDRNSSDMQLDASVKCLLLDKKLILSLSLKDIVNSKGETYTSFSNGVENSFKNYYDEQYLKFSIVYSIGKKIRQNRVGNKNQEEKNRIY